MSQARFEQLLQKTVGLDVASIGPSAVARAVEGRMRLSRHADIDAYWDAVRDDRDELQALVEAVVVPETWFYRDREAFAAMASIIHGEWQASGFTRQFRLLSVPCSTGEEAFTLAMTLLDAGLPPSAFQIEGIDISHRALAKARAGIYGRNSFRGSDLAYRDRHFTAMGADWRISDAVRSSVRFSQGNIFALDQRDGGALDVIFCRNLLIYFNAADQSRAIAVLRRMLAPQGTLFVGHSEGSIFLGEGFTSLKIPRAFAFRGQPAAREKTAPVRAVAKTPVARNAAPSPATRAVSNAVTRPARTKVSPAAAPVRVAAAATVGWEDIRRTADRGDIQTAIKMGRAMLDSGPPTAEALYLLGVIHEAGGDRAAASDHYRKALYLDPHHRDAIAHLALLLEGMGDRSGAQRMAERARRIDARGDA